MELRDRSILASAGRRLADRLEYSTESGAYAKPFYNSIPLFSFLVLASLLTAAVSLWFYTDATVKIAVFPPNGFFYFDQLPAAYWLGIAATIGLLIVCRRTEGRLRTVMEIASLFILCLYLIGLPSFVYENPRFLDTYQHEGNALSFLNTGGWYNNQVWYLYQFPGSYAFFAQLTAVAGIDPFQLMLYYPAVISMIVSLLVYTIARLFTDVYAAPVSSLVMAGFWFQLHESPQSLELILYLGVLYLLFRAFQDRANSRRCSLICIAVTPILVLTHPETSLVTSLGTLAFVLLEPVIRGNRFEVLRSNIRLIGPFLIVLVLTATLWWSFVATAALRVALGIVDSAVSTGISLGPYIPPKAPPTPSPSYAVTLQLEEGMAALTWLLGVSLLLFVKRFHPREYFLSGLFLAAVATIPVALFGNPDVLQRSYMFALFPAAFLSASLLGRKADLRIRRWMFVKPLGVTLILLTILFSVVMPVARYGGDSFQTITGSALATSSVAATTNAHSTLLVHPDWYGYKYYAPFYGYQGAILLEQSNITGRPGAYVKVGTYEWYNLTFTHADNTADYILSSDFFNNLYVMRFGTQAPYYISLRNTFESQATLNFNLVYSSGTDRLYETRRLG
ncbi:hypothetical protein J2P12_06800 [Candidatus Bathyarchaeota archaeon]|nr:hypothetical protein [Candidatus Bathyarchaeota archaeon]